MASVELPEPDGSRAVAASTGGGADHHDVRPLARAEAVGDPEIRLAAELLAQGVEPRCVIDAGPFEYVSAGGNSSQKTTVTPNTPTIDVLIETLGSKIRWRKSASGQRALMTAKLRNFIKSRDDHTCQYCAISMATEPHLLLEVDHVVPISKGGMSIAENLQTLCWKCNRTKSNKV